LLILSLIAVYMAIYIEWAAYLGPGEVATIAVLCRDRLQARTILRYCRGLLNHVPQLAALIDGEHSQRITLTSRMAPTHAHARCFETTQSSRTASRPEAN
jgi:hypothetical protein